MTRGSHLLARLPHACCAAARHGATALHMQCHPNLTWDAATRTSPGSSPHSDHPIQADTPLPATALSSYPPAHNAGAAPQVPPSLTPAHILLRFLLHFHLMLSLPPMSPLESLQPCDTCTAARNRGALDLVGRVYASGAMGVPLCLNVLSGDGGERVVYGDSKGALVLLLCGARELPARDLISTEGHKVGWGGGGRGGWWVNVQVWNLIHTRSKCTHLHCVWIAHDRG